MAEVDSRKQREELRAGLRGLVALLLLAMGSIAFYRGCATTAAPPTTTTAPMAVSGFTTIAGTNDAMLQKIVEKYVPMVEVELGTKFKTPVRIIVIKTVERPDEDYGGECSLPLYPEVDLAATSPEGSTIYFFEDLRSSLVEPQVQVSIRERDADVPAIPPRWKTRLQQVPFASTEECVEAAVIHQLVHAIQLQHRSVRVDTAASSDEHELAGYLIRYEGLAEHATKGILERMNRVDVYDSHIQAANSMGHSAYVVHNAGREYFRLLRAQDSKPGLLDFDRTLSFREVCDAAGFPSRPQESLPPKIPFDDERLKMLVDEIEKRARK